MKHLVLSFFLLVSFISTGQDFQRKRDPIYQTEYEIELIKPQSTVSISRYKSPTETEYSLIIKTQNTQCPKESGVVVVLLNGEQISFSNHLVRCDALSNSSFQLLGSFILSPALYQKLSEQGVAYFMLGEVKIPAQYKEVGESLPQLLKDVAQQK